MFYEDLIEATVRKIYELEEQSEIGNLNEVDEILEQIQIEKEWLKLLFKDYREVKNYE